MEDLIKFTSLRGQTISVPRSKIIQRTGVYAFVFTGRLLIFLNTRTTGKKWLPGGGVNAGESLEDALRREIREETGVEIRILRKLHRMKERFYHDLRREAYVQESHFYACRALTTEFVPEEDPASPGEKIHSPHWIPIEGIDLQQIQPTLLALFSLVRPELLALIEEESE